MSKKVKNLITKELESKFKSMEGLAVINPRGIDGIKTNQIRRRLHDKKLKMTVVKNSLARRAAEGTRVKGFEKLLDGPCAVIYGASSIATIARLLIQEKKTNEKLEIRGIYFDGEIYTGDKGIETASKLPTREEALANLVAAMLGPGRRLAGVLKGPGSKLGGILKTIEDKAKAKEADSPASPVEAAPAANRPDGGPTA